MDIPKSVRYALEQRCSHAFALMKYDTELCHWLESNGIKVEFEDIRGGSEMISNPLDSMKRIIEAIEKAPKKSS